MATEERWNVRVRDGFTDDKMRQIQLGQEFATITSSRMSHCRPGGGRVEAQSKKNKVKGTNPSFSKTILGRIHLFM